jgi:hypothetical protein
VQEYLGGCQCGSIRYRVKGEPISVFICHCSECQRQSSSAFGMALWIKDAELSLLSGTTKTWLRRTKSGSEISCSFCPDCGTRLFHAGHAGSGVLSVKPGTLDDTSWLRPSGHIWTQNAQGWLLLDAEVLQYPGDPPSCDRLIDGWGDK